VCSNTITPSNKDLTNDLDRLKGERKFLFEAEDEETEEKKFIHLKDTSTFENNKLQTTKNYSDTFKQITGIL